MKDRQPIAKLLMRYSSLLRLPGADRVVKQFLGQVQIPLVFKNHEPWTKLVHDLELRSACELYLIEILKHTARRLKHTPTIDQVDRLFLTVSCPSVRYFLFKLNLFERSYRKLLILAHLPLNRNFARFKKRKKRVVRRRTAAT